MLTGYTRGAWLPALLAVLWIAVILWKNIDAVRSPFALKACMAFLPELLLLRPGRRHTRKAP